MQGFIGLAVVGAFFFLAIALILTSRLSRPMKQVLIAALLLRLLTTLYYHEAVFGPGGKGDAFGYYWRGMSYADRMWRGDFSMFWDRSQWWARKWHGTQFVSFPTGIILAVLGRGTFAPMLAYALLAMIGMYCFVVVFQRAYPHVNPTRYAAFLLLLPSGAFWTSAIGKEAIMVLGFGLAARGLLARKGGPNWILAGAGIYLIFGIRPQVAAVVVASLVFAHTVSRKHRWTLLSTLRLGAVLVAGLWVLNTAMREMGTGGASDLAGLQEYVDARAEKTTTDGTSVRESAPGLKGAPIGLFNVLFRPLPIEVRSFTQGMAALELMVFWYFMYRHRKRLMTSLRHWRTDTPLAFSLFFALLYATLLGMIVINLGIIVRQRIYIFPCLLLLLLAEPVKRQVVARYRPPLPPLPPPRRERVPLPQGAR
jgi:hypothetical protein